MRDRAGWRQAWILKSAHPEAHARLGEQISFAKGLLVVPTASRPSCLEDASRFEIPSPCLRADEIEIFGVEETEDWAWHGAIDVPYGEGSSHVLGEVLTDGRRVYVGQPFEPSCPDAPMSCIESGTVSIFSGPPGGLSLEHRVSPPEPVPLMRFGAALAVSGASLIVGAPNAAYAYRLQPSGSGFEAQLEPWPSKARDSEFGTSLALHHGFLAVGASGDTSCRAELDHPDDPQDCTDSGSVYVYDPPPP